jgi:hypothetical protein
MEDNETTTKKGLKIVYISRGTGWGGNDAAPAPAQTYECPFSKNRYSTRNKNETDTQTYYYFFKKRTGRAHNQLIPNGSGAVTQTGGE